MIGNMLSEGALELFVKEVVCRMALRFLSEIPATAAQDLPELTQMFLSRYRAPTAMDDLDPKVLYLPKVTLPFRALYPGSSQSQSSISQATPVPKVSDLFCLCRLSSEVPQDVSVTSASDVFVMAQCSLCHGLLGPQHLSSCF